MLRNVHYDMIEEISEISKSLVRMDTCMNDSKGCDSRKQLWQKIKSQHEEELGTLMEELKNHVKQGAV
jgi:hypothetical protein